LTLVLADSLTHQRLSHSNPDFHASMRKSYKDFMCSNTTLFAELLKDFFRQRSTRSVADTNESSLGIATELLWFEEMQSVLQMHLIVDPTKRWGDGRSGFVDSFVGNPQRRHGAPNSVIVMGLKNVKLLYLLRWCEYCPWHRQINTWCTAYIGS